MILQKSSQVPLEFVHCTPLCGVDAPLPTRCAAQVPLNRLNAIYLPPVLLLCSTLHILLPANALVARTTTTTQAHLPVDTVTRTQALVLWKNKCVEKQKLKFATTIRARAFCYFVLSLHLLGFNFGPHKSPDGWVNLNWRHWHSWFWTHAFLRALVRFFVDCSASALYWLLCATIVCMCVCVFVRCWNVKFSNCCHFGYCHL